MILHFQLPRNLESIDVSNACLYIIIVTIESAFGLNAFIENITIFIKKYINHFMKKVKLLTLMGEKCRFYLSSSVNICAQSLEKVNQNKVIS